MYAFSSPDLPGFLRNETRLLSQPTLLLRNRYHLLKLLGQGGFGRTFLAVDEWQTPLQCVVKQLLPGHSTDHPALTLFDQEAEYLAELGHPQIPKLLDSFEQDGEFFIVQEWIDGWTLEQEVKSTLFDEAEVRQVLQELLPVLQDLHDCQIIHRDIKPANIIRRRSDRQLVLVDFGAAKRVANTQSLYPGTMVGSVEYAAPEQIKGHAVFASDLYSLGVTCLYLLTQMSPFDLYDITENEWKWQAYLPQSISSELRSVLDKLLQPAVRRRYQSATAVLIDLQAASVSIDQQKEDEIASLFTRKTPAAETELLDLNLISSSIQANRSIPGAATYFSQTSDWYYLPDRMNVSEIGAAFFLRPSTASTAAALVQEAPLFADDIAAPKALPLVRQALIVGVGAAVGSVVMACLVICLSIILLAASSPQPSDATSLDNQPILK